MNPEQARTRVAETFSHAFDRAKFLEFNRNLLNKFDESKAAQWNATYVKDAFKPHVARFERLGTYTSPDDDKLDVLVVHLTNESKLERARTAIRNFVADHLKTREEKDAALVAFVSPTESQWRFSYVKMEYAAVETESGKVGVETRLTPARRFSYIVGEGESCHTAQTRFLGLLEDTENFPALAQLEDAFSVEAVTKEFFNEYASLFGDIEAALRKLAAKYPVIGKEFKAKDISTVDFAKKLMGQIVFLYFLQKKGWLGVGKGQEWGTGPDDFLRRLVQGDYGPYENFFNDILEPLFYDTLATDRGHEAWCKVFKCRIPFLNGGLFEPLSDYDWRKVDIILPNKMFTNIERSDAGDIGTGILDVFDRYNFTVNEAEPLEKEVAIDPEMLGKVFENLIEENRRKGLGSYYTPREIVHYMCQESLITFLDAALNSRAETVASEKRKKAGFSVEQTRLTAPTRSELVSRADLETFVHLGDQISHYEAVDTRYPYRMPKSIEQYARLIDENLADITICDPAVGSGAFPVGMMTEIVRARSALTPYFNDVHDRTPYHFKRHAIQNCLYGVDIDAGAVEIAKLRLWLSLVVDEEDGKQIKPLPNLFYKIVSGNSLMGVEKNLFNQQLFRRLEELKPHYFNESDKHRKDRYKQQIEDTIHELTNGKEVFDFAIYFSEVFHRKRGFDVVIANPPYIPIEAMIPEDRTRFQSRFPELQRKFDSAAVFILASLELLNRNGNLTFISSVTWQTGENYSALRRHLFTTAGVHTLVNLPFDVFEAAYVDTGVYLLLKQPTASYRICLLGKKARLEELQKPNYAEVAVDLVQPPRFKLVLNPLAALLLGRVRKLSDVTTLGEITESTQGLAASFYTQSRKPVSQLHLPFAPKAQLRRYHLKLNETGYADMSEHRSLVRFYDARPKLLIRRIINRQDRIDAAHTEKAVVFKKDINPFVITRDKFDVRYILALLNSRFISWLYVNTSSIATKDDFRQTTLAELRELPIPAASPEKQKMLGRLVDRILAAKQRDAGVNVSALERDVDQLVYALYGLTPEEVKIVEGATQ